MTSDEPLTSRAWFLRGLRDALGSPTFLLMTTMLGIGGLARDVGFPVWAGTLSTLLVWAGPAQVILFGAIGSGASLPATAFAVALSSARFLPMTVSILPLIRKGGAGVAASALCAHFVSMTTWVEGLKHLPRVPADQRVIYFVGYGTMLILCAALATHVGFYLYALLPIVLTAAFLFTTPLFFTSAMVAGARTRADWLALGMGFLLTPVLTPYLPAGFDFLIIGGVGGTVAYLLHRKLRGVVAQP